MNWHPFSEKFPIIDGKEWDEFKESIKATGGNTVPIVCRMVGNTKQGLDGRHRQQACEELGLPCREECKQIPDEKVKGFILACNLHRRHLTKEARQEIIKEMRADGYSLGEIAAVLKVGKTTVHRELERDNSRATVPNGTPEFKSASDNDLKNSPSTQVQGLDGKSYSATQPERLLCDGCKKRGKPVVGCQECRELRFGKPREPGDESRRGPRPRKNGQELYDWKGMDGDFGRVARIPEGICAAYGHHERQSAEYREAREGLEVFIRAVSRWKKRLTAVDVRIVSAQLQGGEPQAAPPYVWQCKEVDWTEEWKAEWNRRRAEGQS